jgi:hypothetical protein
MADTLLSSFHAEMHAPAGVPLFVRHGGRGPALLQLLHGHLQTHAMWHRIAPALARRFTLAMPDLRGFGRSTRVAAPDGGSDPGAHARRLQAAAMHTRMLSLGHPGAVQRPIDADPVAYLRDTMASRHAGPAPRKPSRRLPGRRFHDMAPWRIALPMPLHCKAMPCPAATTSPKSSQRRCSPMPWPSSRLCRPEP